MCYCGYTTVMSNLVNASEDLELLDRQQKKDHFYSFNVSEGTRRHTDYDSFANESSNNPFTTDNQNDDNGNEMELSPEQQEMTKPSLKSKLLGMLFALLSAVLYTSSAALIKELHSVDELEFLIISSVVKIIIIFAYMKYMKWQFIVQRKALFYIFTQLLLYSLGVISAYLSFRSIPLGDAAAVIACCPIFVVFFSIPLLKVYSGAFYNLLVTILMIVGLCFLFKPSFIFPTIVGEHRDYTGYLFALGSAALYGFNTVIAKKIEDVHAIILVLVWSSSSIIIPPILLFTVGTPTLLSVTQSLLCVLGGLISLADQLFFVMSVKLIMPTGAIMIWNLQVVMAYILQTVLWQDIPVWTNIVGAFFVILSVLFSQLEDII